MRPGIHPEYKKTLITCACGRVSETRSTVEELHVEICSHCHPFFTGRQKLVDTAGRVERFIAKYGEGGSRAPAEAANDVGEADTAVAVEVDSAAEGEEAPAEDQPKAEAEDRAEAEAEDQPEAEAEDQPEAEAEAPADEEPEAAKA